MEEAYPIDEPAPTTHSDGLVYRFALRTHVGDAISFPRFLPAYEAGIASRACFISEAG